MKMFKYKRIKDNNINSHFLITSFLGLIICATCLCLTTYAWFTSTINTSVSSINTPTYVLYYSVDEKEKVELSFKDNEEVRYTTYTPDTNDSISITLSTGENDNGTGYCLIKIGDDTYYTSLITKYSSYTFNVTNAKDKTIIFIPCWGNIEKDESYKEIGDGGITFEASEISNEEQEKTTGDETKTNESDATEVDETEVEKGQESTEENKDSDTSAEGSDEDSSKSEDNNKTEESDNEGEDVKQEEAEENAKESSSVDESLATETTSTSEVIEQD